MTALPLFNFDRTASSPTEASYNIVAAARAMVSQLNRSRALDRKLVANIMTTTFGGADAEGVWNWRDAYDATEAALVLQQRRLASQVARLEDSPAETVSLLAVLSGLTLTHTRRSEEQVALDQFSTPPQLAAIAVAAAQIRTGDRVLEPSAGTGLLAIIAEVCGASLHLNELSPDRASILDVLFPQAARTRHDARLLKDLLPASGSFHAVVANPPFEGLQEHLHGGLDCLADGGRMSAIVPSRVFDNEAALRSLAARGRIVTLMAFPPRAFAKHGTSIETGLIVIDRGSWPEAGLPRVVCADTLEQAALTAVSLTDRPTAKPRAFQMANNVTSFVPRVRELATPSGRFAFVSRAVPLDYLSKPWSGEGHDVGLYQAYSLGRVSITGAAPHPSSLVESGPMASVSPPPTTYRPLLPPHMVSAGELSDAQLETVIYAGEAHSNLLPGRWRLGEAPHQVNLVGDSDHEGFQFRRGFFLGDGTGCGKGRQIAGIIVDNIAQGRDRAVWFSKNEPLLEDCRRDWKAIGGAASDIAPQSAWKQSEAIRMDRGILFTTYSTLRQPSRSDRPSRLDQIVNWLGKAFDGVIVFDEAHAMANAAGGGKGSRGTKKASLQGMAGLALQNRLPLARIVYVSATGATTPENLAYAPRLGLWGGPGAPFVSRDKFMEAVDEGGVAVMELIARELKAMGLYIARSLSFDGVEYEALRHPLSDEDVAIWDAWADAYYLIHQNLRAALEAVGITEDGKGLSGQAVSQALSAFESCKQRFFGNLLSGLKAATLVESIRADLASERSAIVQIVSTNEAVMERRLAEIPPEEWNNLSIDLSPKDSTLEYLKGAFPVTAMQAIENDDGSVTMIPLMDGGKPVVSQQALALRDELIVHLACLPSVPGVLDTVLEAFGPDAVAEITGRSRRIVVKDGRKVVERRGASAARAETEAFLAGKKRILIFSDAGGTGRSYHADLNCANQQRRVQYLAEAGWRADAAIQGLGRSHRTNQACAPLFRPVTTDIHGEKRFLSTIARRLDSLGALTRGERRTAGNGLFRAEDNLESPWARRALLALYGEMRCGEAPPMSRLEFEDKTGLRLTDSDGSLLKSDDLPPMNTFLNRLLALRIEDQNRLFAAFDATLSAILERAAASGKLDKGMEDIVPDDLTVEADEVVRTDGVNQGQTRLVTLSLRTERQFITADDAVWGQTEDALDYVRNSKSGKIGLVVKGLTMFDDDDRRLKAVRLIRPERRTMIPLKQYEESAWEPFAPADWRAAWDAEIAGTDPCVTRKVGLVTGLLLPIWSNLPRNNAAVRRVKSPDGRRWLGRLIDIEQIPFLKLALGISDVAATVGSGEGAARLVLEDNTSIVLGGNLWLRRARVMDRYRIEIVGGATHKDALTLLGCFVEIINYAPRVFVPTDKPEVLDAVLQRWPAQSFMPAAAA